MATQEQQQTFVRTLLFTGLILGLGWAIRGVFGHWWGASWAGGMGMMAFLLMSRNENWLQRLPIISVLAAVGWGVGGIMSYGIVIGYCKSTDFANSWYGYSMLAVIGGLYGFIGGGLPALAMESREDHRPDWPRLLVEMSVIGYLAYWLIITEMEWYMTPPRSEDWAVAFGAAFALAWYAYRNKFYSTLRVAAFAALGGGFGFAFGNFIQTMGTVSGISYNWWNVMEFTLGLCGGIGMAYGVLSSRWPDRPLAPAKKANWIGLAVLFFVIPFLNFYQQFTQEKLSSLAERLERTVPDAFVSGQQWLAFGLILVFTALAVYSWREFRKSDRNSLPILFPTILLFAYSLFYMLFGYLKHGSFFNGFSLARSETSYWFLIAIAGVVAFLDRKRTTPLLLRTTANPSWQRFLWLFGIVMLVLILIAWISAGSHDGLSGAHDRF